MTTTKHVHTIPVPHGMTWREAWAEICILGKLNSSDPFAGWANVECDGEECGGIFELESK